MKRKRNKCFYGKSIPEMIRNFSKKVDKEHDKKTKLLVHFPSEVLIGDCFTHITSGENFIVVSIKKDLRRTTIALWHESEFKERTKNV